MRGSSNTLHFELTGDDVSECIGGATNLKVEDLNINYETYCDPRLNYCQSMEMTFLLAELLGSQEEEKKRGQIW